MATQALNRVKASEIELKDKLVAVNRVTKVTKGGRTFSFSAIVVVGDEHGIVGHGLGKAKEVTEAITKGIDDAKKNLIKVPILRGTVPHAQKGKFGGAEVLLKSQGSSNPHNVVKATMDALANMRDAVTVARQRGISLDKVFNG